MRGLAVLLIGLAACGGTSGGLLEGSRVLDAGAEASSDPPDGAPASDAADPPGDATPSDAAPTEDARADDAAPEAAPACGPSTCPFGCCTAAGACLVFVGIDAGQVYSQQSNEACGSGGQACQQCPPADAGFACAMVTKYGVGAPGNVIGGWCCEPNATTCTP